MYHWAPGNAALVFDRLPIAWACATLVCALLAERVHPRCPSWPALLAALALATVSVLVWWFTEQRGSGDLRAYLFVQFLPMLIVPATLLLRLQPDRATPLTSAGAWWVVLALYASAKRLELADHAVFASLAVASGHTLKHLLAATAAGGSCTPRSAAVVGVDLHVVVAQVAGPDRGLRACRGAGRRAP